MATNLSRSIVEGTRYQGEDEKIAYKIDVTNVGDSTVTPSSLVVEVKDVDQDYLDVTTVTMPSGTPSAAGQIITLPGLTNLVDGHEYRVEISFDKSGNIFEVWLPVIGEL